MEFSIKDVGQHLIDHGWRQGSLMPAVGRVHYELTPNGSWEVRLRDPKDGERLIVVSQDCDIRANSELFVETMPCYWAPTGTPEFNGSRGGNSGRYFLLQDDGVGKKRRALVVDATDRVQILKTSLLDLPPDFAVPEEQTDNFYRRFRPWLGGRYSRIPLDPDVVKFVQGPIANLIKELSGNTELDPRPVLREMRMSPVRGVAPFVLNLAILLKDGASTSDDRVANLIGGLYETFADATDGTRIQKCTAYTSDELTVYDYERTWKLPYDYFSWEGNEEIGPPPVRGIDHG